MTRTFYNRPFRNHSQEYIRQQDSVRQSQRFEKKNKTHKMELQNPPDNETMDRQNVYFSWKDNKLCVTIFIFLALLSIVSTTICCTLFLTKGSNINRITCNFDSPSQPITGATDESRMPDEPTTEGSGWSDKNGNGLQRLPDFGDRFKNDTRRHSAT